MNATKQKKILMLGGLRYLIPVIKAAHELGYYVITCDYLPNNIAHQYSDEYHNVNIIDKDAVLSLAKTLQIDGILSFAVDPGVTTAAYVSEQLGLPGNPYKSVEILQNKVLFRQFLKDNGFNVPKFKGYKSIDDACRDIKYFHLPIIVKPSDSAGSKGVTKVSKPECLYEAAKYALDTSLSKEFIIEEFIEKKNYTSDSDAFSVNGKLQFISFSDQRFDNEAANPYTPSAYSWPSSMNYAYQEQLSAEIQRLISLLHMGTSIYNIETRIGQDGQAYIMEVSPRGGGNRLSEMLHYATGINLIKNTVQAALGEENIHIKPMSYKGYWGEVILHADKNGIFDKIEIEDSFRKDHVIELDLWVKAGEKVKAFKGANDTIGTLVLRFDSKEQVSEMMDSIKKYIKISIK